MKKILREPLLHFLLIGAALFMVFGLVNDRTFGDADTRIVVSAGRIEQLSIIFAKTWQRPATPEELQGVVDDFVLEEIYYRQAMAMGIDRDDTVIRRRLRQKLEFLTDDMAAAVAPTDAELTTYLATNADVFRRDTTYTFEQMYFNPDRPDSNVHLAEILAALRDGNDAVGDSGLLPRYYEATPAQSVDGSFGVGFSASLDALPTGEWQGPIESGLGLHLVQLRARVHGTLPDLTDIRPIVEREWANEKRLETRRLINEQLLSDYEVVVAWPAE